MTLWNNTLESCAYAPAKTRLLHRGFDDPRKLAESANDEEEAMAHYRRVRDETRAFVEKLPATVGE